jgi:hypothetical protein
MPPSWAKSTSETTSVITAEEEEARDHPGQEGASGSGAIHRGGA